MRRDGVRLFVRWCSQVHLLRYAEDDLLLGVINEMRVVDVCLRVPAIVPMRAHQCSFVRRKGACACVRACTHAWEGKGARCECAYRNAPPRHAHFMPPCVVRRLWRACRPTCRAQVESGAVVIGRGEVVDTLYIIRTGSVSV